MVLQRTISPVDGRVYVERELADGAAIQKALDRAAIAGKAWRDLPVAERVKVLSRAVDAFVADRDEIAAEITWQMGRPIAQAPGEVRGFEERARHGHDATRVRAARRRRRSGSRSTPTVRNPWPRHDGEFGEGRCPRMDSCSRPV